MRVETKFGIGDKCCVVEHNKIINGTIESIEIIVEKNQTSIDYCIRLAGGLSQTTTKPQKETFVSTNNALEYLKENVVK